MVRFLRFLVAYRLSGNENRLNERMIGTLAFGKRADWDPREDTIVRTEARRLRIKLDQYYLGPGRTERIHIRVPKGGYHVQLERTEQHPSEPDRPPQAPTERTGPDQAEHAEARHRRLAWVFASALALTIAMLALWRPWQLPGTAARPGETFEIVPLANELGQEYSPAVSPDGKKVAYVWDGDGLNFNIYMKDIAGGVAQRITDDARPDLYPTWSPDGKNIAYVRKGDAVNDIVVRPFAGGPERRIAQIAMEFGHWADDDSPLLGDPGPAWTHDGKHLIVADVAPHAPHTGLYSVSLETGAWEPLTAPPGETRDFYPKVSPDGKTLAYVRYLTHGIGQLHLLPIDPNTARPSGKSRQLTFQHETLRGIGWAAGGRSLLFASNLRGQFQLWSVDTATGDRKTVNTDTSSVADPAQGPLPGELVFTKLLRNWNVWQAPLVNGAMRTPHRLLSSSGVTRDPSYSPDGSRIAFVSDRTGEMQVYVAAADGSRQHRVTDIRGIFTSAPVWSPDSGSLAFDARPEGHAGIYIVPAEGGPARPLNRTQAEERAPFWSRDGRSIYFNSNRSGVVAIWKKTLPDGDAIQVAGKDSFLAQESPDGKTLYFSDIHGNMFAGRPDGSHAQALPSAVHPVPVNSWVPTDTGLYFTTPLPNGHSQIERYDGGRIQRVGETSAPLVVNAKDIAVSPDGKSILFAEQDFVGSDVVVRRSLAPP